MLNNKLVEVEVVLEVEKKKSSNATTEVDDLKRQLTCLNEKAC